MPVYAADWSTKEKILFLSRLDLTDPQDLDALIITWSGTLVLWEKYRMTGYIILTCYKSVHSYCMEF